MVFLHQLSDFLIQLCSTIYFCLLLSETRALRIDKIVAIRAIHLIRLEDYTRPLSFLDMGEKETNYNYAEILKKRRFNYRSSWVFLLKKLLTNMMSSETSGKLSINISMLWMVLNNKLNSSSTVPNWLPLGTDYS